MLPQLRDLAEKNQSKGLVVIAVNAANPTTTEDPTVVQRFAVQNRLVGRGFGMALDGRLAAQAYGVTAQHTWFLIDRTGRVALRGTGWNADDETRVTQKVDVASGNLPPDFGWRRDITASFQRAEEAFAAGKLDEAQRTIKNLLPPRTLVIEADYRLVPAQYERGVKAAVARAMTEWKRQLGSVVEVTLREVSTEIELPNSDKKEGDKPAGDKKKEEKPAKANVELKFQRVVLDPLDDSGLRTRCSLIRVVNEADSGMSMRQGQGDTPYFVRAQVAVGHGQDAAVQTHTGEAITHMVGAAIGRALGLAARDDDTSITRDGEMDGLRQRITLAPSREDMVALGNLVSTLNLRLGEVYLQQKKYEEAREPLQLAAAMRVNPASDKATQYLRSLPAPPAAAPGAGNAPGK